MREIEGSLGNRWEITIDTQTRWLRRNWGISPGRVGLLRQTEQRRLIGNMLVLIGVGFWVAKRSFLIALIRVGKLERRRLEVKLRPGLMSLKI